MQKKSNKNDGKSKMEPHTTIDHEIIRRWIEDRRGKPARAKDIDVVTEGAMSILEIDFGKPTRILEEISWDEFFDLFEKNNLAFLYQEEDNEGRKSTFFKFIIRREDEDALDSGGNGWKPESEDIEEEGKESKKKIVVKENI